MAGRKGAKVHQMDVNTAFLYSPLSEEVYIEQPEGLEVAGKNPTWESFITNLRNVHDFDAGGLEPAFDYTQVPKVGQKCWYFVTIHKGKFVPDGKTPKCGKIITGL